MAAKSCAEGGTNPPHIGGESPDGPPHTIVVGKELVTYQHYVCNNCGAGTRNEIVNRERNDN